MLFRDNKSNVKILNIGVCRSLEGADLDNGDKGDNQRFVSNQKKRRDEMHEEEIEKRRRPESVRLRSST